MGILGRLFGTETAIKEGMGMVKDGLDALVYTDEEKAVDAAKERTEGRQMLVRWMEASQGQNLSRRIIALSVTAVWLGQIVAAQLVSIYSIFSNSPSQLMEIVNILRQGASDMDGPTMLVMGFYFAAPHMGKFVSAWANGRKQ